MKFDELNIKKYNLVFSTVIPEEKILAEQFDSYFKNYDNRTYQYRGSFLASYIIRKSKNSLNEGVDSLAQLKKFQEYLKHLDERNKFKISIGDEISVLQFWPHTSDKVIEVRGNVNPKKIKDIYTEPDNPRSIEYIEFTDGTTYPDKHFINRGQGGGDYEGLSTLFFDNKFSADKALVAASIACPGPWHLSLINLKESRSDLNEEQVNEVRMGKSDLDLFVDSPEAEGIRAGFEAELCFRGKGGGDPDYDNPEPDYDQDERVDSIEEACNFFDDGDFNGRRDISDLRESMENDYLEWRSQQLEELWSEVEEETVRDWIEENSFDFDDAVETYLRDTLDLDEEAVEAALEAGKEFSKATNSRVYGELKDKGQAYAHYAEAADSARDLLDQLIEVAISERDSDWERAREVWEENMSEDHDISEHRWLRDQGMRYMSDVTSNYTISWPYYTYPESESGFNENSAEDIAGSLKRSLDLKQVMVGGGYHTASRRPGRWIIEPDGSLEADDGDMPAEIVSPPMPLQECLEKLVEFFSWAEGEDAYTNESTGLHVGVSLPTVGGDVDYLKLALFLGDQYVLEKFEREGNTYCKSALEKIQGDIQDRPERVANTIKLMQHNLIELAAKTLKETAGHGKYTSINLKGEYVEFRSMGGDYIDKIGEITQMVKRYAYAMWIASRPDMYREEYTKKLYKLLSKSGEPTSIHLFAQFNSGILTKEELKERLKAIHAYKKPPQAPQQGATTDTGNDTASRYTPRQGGEFTGSWLILDPQGRTIHRFGGIGNVQSDANRIAIAWLRANPGNMRSGITVVPDMR